jgi:tetratricopeptide (TPR) repeat protein
MLVGDLLELTGAHFKAIRHYQMARDSALTSAEARRAEGAVEAIRRRYQAELDLRSRRAEERPDDLVAVGQLANLRLALLQLDQAEAGYRHILSVKPDHPAARYNLGLVLVRRGEPALAAAEIERAIQHGLRRAETYNQLGVAHRAAGRLDRAIAAYKQASQADPKQWRAAYNVGQAYLALGKRDEARKAFELAHRRAAAIGRKESELIKLQVDRLRE